MGFDVGKASQGLEQEEPMTLLDLRRVLRDVSSLPSVNDTLRQHRRMLHEISTGGFQQSIQASVSRALSAARAAHTASWDASASIAQINEGLRASRIASESLRRGLPGFDRSLLHPNYARMQADTLRQRIRAVRDIGSSVASQMYEIQSASSRGSKMQEILSAHNDAWRIRRVQTLRTPALQHALKSTPTFGPIVVSPDDTAPPSNYHPDLQGWLIPETTTDSGDDKDVEELVAVVFSYALGIAQHHRTRVLVTVVGKHGGAFLIRVAENTVAGLLVYWLLSR